MIQPRIAMHPNRRKITKISQIGDVIIADIEHDDVAEGVSPGNEGTSVTAAMLNGIATALSVYPVGSIYMTVNDSYSPAQLFGGDWARWGQGRVPVGMGNNSETNYIVTEATGGSENGVAAHAHTAANTAPSDTGSATLGAHTGQVIFYDGTYNSLQDVVPTGVFGTTGTVARKSFSSSSGNETHQGGFTMNATHAAHMHTLAAHTHTINSSGTSGGNRMPYITCYMWKRIA